MPILQLIVYASLSVFLIGIIVKIIKITRMPIHLRWELYPIPHEMGKGSYGGSRYEELDWWTRPLKTSRIAEAAEMTKEIFAIKTLYRHNRGFWYFSLPFHWGLYFLAIFLCLLVGGSFMEMAGADLTTAFGKLIFSLTGYAAVCGWTLGAIGAIGLLITRVMKSKYRAYSLVSDYFNLLLLMALFFVGIAGYASLDNSLEFYRAFVLGLITIKSVPEMPALINIEVAIAAFFLAYLPFTHMTHFFGKFFTFHCVRWQDNPSAPGNGIENDVADALRKRVGWIAPHMSPGKTWAEGAAGNGNVEGE